MNFLSPTRAVYEALRLFNEEVKLAVKIPHLSADSGIVHIHHSYFDFFSILAAGEPTVFVSVCENVGVKNSNKVMAVQQLSSLWFSLV